MITSKEIEDYEKNLKPETGGTPFKLEFDKEDLRIMKARSAGTRDAFYRAQQNLEDKLKTTPSAGLTFIGKTFNIKKLWKKITNTF